jgi:hypothetical protein
LALELLPTAMQLVLEVHATAPNEMVVAPATLGGACAVHSVPSHASARGA